MQWFGIALLGPLFWSISNHLDKFLLNKHLRGIGKEALVLYSTIFGLVVLPIAYIIEPSIFNISFKNILILITAGFFNSLGIYLYLSALEKEETSIVVPFFQTIPVFGFIFGFILLGEILNIKQIIAVLVIILGSAVLSLEIDELNKIKVKRFLIVLILGSSAAFAFYETIFKFVVLRNTFWVSTFWQYLGLFIFGIVLFSISKKYRQDFIFLIKKHNWRLFRLNIINESLTVIGNTFYNFSLLLAPIALVMTVNAYQPVLVFLEGLLLTFFFPKIMQEKTAFKHLLHKGAAIAIVFTGTIMLYN